MIRFLVGAALILMSLIIGIAEVGAFLDPDIAQYIAAKFVEHDPFPRLPWDMHVIFIAACLLLLGEGLHLILRKKRQN